MNNIASIRVLLEKLKRSDRQRIRALIGLDGFVDEVIHVVDKRDDADHFTRIERMAQFGDRISSHPGQSKNFEFVSIQRKLGGNGPNLANSLINCGCETTYIGALGLPELHPVFADMASRANVISISEPGYTQAIEFFDGKLICSKLETLKAVDPKNLDSIVGAPALARMISESDFVGIENWTLVIHMTDVWRYLLDKVLPLVETNSGRKLLFIDLCDPEKRRAEDLNEALAVLGRFSSHFRVTLGLNLKEACEIARLKGMEIADYLEADIAAVAAHIKRHLNIDTLVVHRAKEALSISDTGVARAESPYCEQPRLTTGAGDNFNAGYMLGRALGRNEEESLITGVANAGYYVRYGQSPRYAELLSFIAAWMDGRIEA